MPPRSPHPRGPVLPWLRDAAMCVGVFVAFDVLGVLLTLVADALGFLYYTLNTSSLLPYVIWFVIGVFTATALYFRDPPRSELAGRRVVVCATAVAVAVGLWASSLWSWSGEPVAPDHPGATLTWLVTTVLGTLVWHRLMTSDPRPR